MKKIFGMLLLLVLACPTGQAYMGKSFETPINVCVSHILVPSEADALRMKSIIKDFDEFGQFAKMYSECPSGRTNGYLGCFGRGQMVRQFEDAAFKGKIGEITGPVKTQYGYHLIWVTRKY